jgi:hypothetical protein
MDSRWSCIAAVSGRAEVGDLDDPLVRHQGVARLDVLMNQPEFVSGVQAPAELNGLVQDLLQARQPSLLDQRRQRAALHELGENGDLVSHRPEKPAATRWGCSGKSIQVCNSARKLRRLSSLRRRARFTAKGWPVDWLRSR